MEGWKMAVTTLMVLNPAVAVRPTDRLLPMARVAPQPCIITTALATDWECLAERTLAQLTTR